MSEVDTMCQDVVEALNKIKSVVCEEHHIEEAEKCPYCMLIKYQDALEEERHVLSRFQESEKSLAEELIDALKRAEQAEKELAEAQHRIEVQSSVIKGCEAKLKEYRMALEGMQAELDSVREAKLAEYENKENNQ